MSTTSISIPPAREVREKLAAVQAEARYLRRLLKLAKEREEAERLFQKTAKRKEVRHD